jgi:hypothetical protein
VPEVIMKVVITALVVWALAMIVAFFLFGIGNGEESGKIGAVLMR